MSFEKGRKITCTADPMQAYRFPDVSEALEQMGMGFRKFRFVNADTAQRPRPYAIFTGTSYIEQVTQSNIYYTHKAEKARRFASKAEAARYIQKLISRWPKAATFTVVDTTAENAVGL